MFDFQGNDIWCGSGSLISVQCHQTLVFYYVLRKQNITGITDLTQVCPKDDKMDENRLNSSFMPAESVCLARPILSYRKLGQAKLGHLDRQLVDQRKHSTRIKRTNLCKLTCKPTGMNRNIKPQTNIGKPEYKKQLLHGPGWVSRRTKLNDMYPPWYPP